MRPIQILLLSLLFLLAAPAFASDGVLEINQTCATQTGCFPGDTPGFPVTIGTSGSYRLTSDLLVPNQGIDGLFLTAARVEIDFNGFALSGTPFAPGSANGIAGSGTDGSNARNAVLRNGVIRTFLNRGVALGGASGVRIEHMVLEANSAGGAALGDQAIVERSTFTNNGASTTTNHALTVGVASNVRDSTIRNSGGRGIDAGENSTVLGNAVRESGDHGIYCTEMCVIRSNTVYDSGLDGIVGDTSIIEGNVVRLAIDDGIHGLASTITNNVVSGAGGLGIQTAFNGIVTGNAVRDSTGNGVQGLAGALISGNTVFGSDGNGILAGSDALVDRNTVRGNMGIGISMSSGAGYRGNVINSNTGAAVFAGIELDENVCNDDTTCP